MYRNKNFLFKLLLCTRGLKLWCSNYQLMFQMLTATLVDWCHYMHHYNLSHAPMSLPTTDTNRYSYTYVILCIVICIYKRAITCTGKHYNEIIHANLTHRLLDFFILNASKVIICLFNKQKLKKEGKKHVSRSHVVRTQTVFDCLKIKYKKTY